MRPGFQPSRKFFPGVGSDECDMLSKSPPLVTRLTQIVPNRTVKRSWTAGTLDGEHPAGIFGREMLTSSRNVSTV
jgi:hypothetical protein